MGKMGWALRENVLLVGASTIFTLSSSSIAIPGGLLCCLPYSNPTRKSLRLAR